MKIHHLLVLLILPLLWVQCKKDPDDDPNLMPVELSGTQSTTLVLENIFNNPDLVDYIVTGTWRIEAAVEIEPGVRIQMKAGSKIEVRANGSLKAAGTGSMPIFFEGEQNAKGYWEYIQFDSNNPNNELSHCIISHGGGSTLSSRNASVVLLGNAQLSMQNSTVRQSARNGIRLAADDCRLPVFQGNTISDCDLHPVSFRTPHMGFIDATSSMSANGFNSIEVAGSTLRVPATVNSATVPYLLRATNRLEAAMEVQAGTAFLMAAGARIEVRSDGSLALLGTPGARITVQGEQEAKGYWETIYYNSSNSPNNQILYTDIAHGGKSTLSCCGGNVSLSGATLSMGNSSLTNSSRYGLVIRSNSTFDDLGGNTFGDNDLGDIFQ
jgi:hypothetical protein